jgi:hypothetical protein
MSTKQARRRYIAEIFATYEDLTAFYDLMHTEQIQHALESETVKPTNLRNSEISTVIVSNPYID